MTGTVFDIQRTALTDGPGIRTTVFVKGCPLRCLWCHNPESQKTGSEIMVFAERCVRCGACVKVCPEGCHRIQGDKHIFDPSDCVACRKCYQSCPADAIDVKGDRMTVDEVFAIVEKDKTYYDASGGGITVSGGEPLAAYNADFVKALLQKCRSAGIGTCVETSGFVDTEILKEFMPLIDVFLFDYKATGEETHRKLTGVSNELILRNMDLIYTSGKDIIMRCPLVPGFNVAADPAGGDAHLDGIIAMSEKYPDLRGIEIMAYHNMGVAKHERLGTDPLCDLDNTDEETKAAWLDYLHKGGCSKAILG